MKCKPWANCVYSPTSCASKVHQSDQVEVSHLTNESYMGGTPHSKARMLRGQDSY